MFETLFTYSRVLRRHREGPPGRGACRLPGRSGRSLRRTGNAPQTSAMLSTGGRRA